MTYHATPTFLKDGRKIVSLAMEVVEPKPKPTLGKRINLHWWVTFRNGDRQDSNIDWNNPPIYDVYLNEDRHKSSNQ